MTKGAAINQFFNNFLTAYPATSVPDNAQMPYLTYDYMDGSFYDGSYNMAVNLWYRTTNEAEPNAKAQEMSRAIGSTGLIIRCDGGGLWIKRGTPFCQVVKDVDNAIKRRYINVIVEFLTND